MAHVAMSKIAIIDLRLPGTYAAKLDKIRPSLHVSRNSSVTRPYFKNLTGKKTPLRFVKYGVVTELLREMCKGGLIFIYYIAAY